MTTSHLFCGPYRRTPHCNRAHLNSPRHPRSCRVPSAAGSLNLCHDIYSLHRGTYRLYPFRGQICNITAGKPVLPYRRPFTPRLADELHDLLVASLPNPPYDRLKAAILHRTTESERTRSRQLLNADNLQLKCCCPGTVVMSCLCAVL